MMMVKIMIDGNGDYDDDHLNAEHVSYYHVSDDDGDDGDGDDGKDDDGNDDLNAGHVSEGSSHEGALDRLLHYVSTPEHYHHDPNPWEKVLDLRNLQKKSPFFALLCT